MPEIYTAAHPAWNPWTSDRNTLELYRRRCRREIEEMTCAAQAAEIVSSLEGPGETLLDAGCGGGYYLWSLMDRGVKSTYFGLDYTPCMVDLARWEICPRAGIPEKRFRLGAIEYLDEEFDTILCFNVLTNSPHYALPLERLLYCTRKRIIIRESMADELVVRYTADPYLDPDKRHIKVYHNTYPLAEVEEFIQSYGFRTTRIHDRRTDDGKEMVVDIPHYWRIILAERN